jgi:hypothetical protein
MVNGKERSMPARGEVVLQVRFGPAATPMLLAAVSFAAQQAEALEEVDASTWRAKFRLNTDEACFGRALQLLGMVSAWRFTTLEVSGSPEQRQVVRAMVACAREWLRREGVCRATFATPIAPKCRCCPLYDPAWALESPPPRSTWSDGEGPTEQAPDHVPPEWVDRSGEGG